MKSNQLKIKEEEHKSVDIEEWHEHQRELLAILQGRTELSGKGFRHNFRHLKMG